jgi:hypothetical protein
MWKKRVVARPRGRASARRIRRVYLDGARAVRIVRAYASVTVRAGVMRARAGVARAVTATGRERGVRAGDGGGGSLSSGLSGVGVGRRNAAAVSGSVAARAGSGHPTA